MVCRMSVCETEVSITSCTHTRYQLVSLALLPVLDPMAPILEHLWFLFGGTTLVYMCGYSQVRYSSPGHRYWSRTQGTNRNLNILFVLSRAGVVVIGKMVFTKQR